MSYAPAELGIRVQEDQPYGQGAADLAATRERQQAAQQTGKPDAAPPPAMTSRGRGSGAINPGRMADPTTNDVPQADPPDWPADIALRQPQHDSPPSGAELGLSASQARQYLISRPTRQYGGHPEQTSMADPVAPTIGNFGRKMTPQTEARVGNLPVVKQVGDFFAASHQITEAGLGFLDSIDPQHRDRYYANVAAKAKELNLPPTDPNVMWQAAQEQWLQETEPLPGIKGLIEMLVDPANLFFVGAGEAVAAVREAGGAAAAAGKVGKAASEGGAKAAGSFADAMGARVPQAVTRASYQDSPEVLRLQSIAERLKAVGATKDAAEIEAQLKTVRGQDAVAKPAEPDAAQLAREAAIKAGTATPSDIVPGEAAPSGTKVRPTPAAAAAKTKLQMPGGAGKTPFESPANKAAGITKAEAKPPIVYPSIENLGIPKGLLESLPENLRNMVVDEARAHYDDIQVARGGVVPPSAVDAEARSILVDAGVLAQAKPRMPVTAPGMLALQRAIMRVSEERLAIESEAAALGPAGVSDQLRARFAVKVFEQNSLQRVVAGARAEWGRVGQAMQAAIKSGDEVRLRNTYNDILKAVGKDNIDKVMERLQAIRSDPNLIGNPYARQVAEFKLVHNLGNATAWQKLDEVFYNAVLSNPHTHAGIMVGQMVLHEAETLVAELGGAAINAAASAATLGRIPYEQTFTKAIGAAIGGQVGIATGLRAAKVFLLTGIKRDSLASFVETGRVGRSHAVQNVGPRIKGVVPVAPIGSVINVPTTLIDTYTVAFHEMGREQSLWGQAFEKAQQEKVGSVFSKAFRARVVELLDDPVANLDVQAARDQGRRVSLRGQPNNKLAEIGRSARDLEIPRSTPFVGKILGGFAPGRRVIPFVNIAFNLGSVGLEYSPLGFVHVLNPANQLGAGARSMATARASLGSLLFAHLMSKADQGQLTGAMPTDPNERAEWNRDGKQAYSYKVGNQWVPFDRILGPMATPARWVAGINTALKEAEGKPLDGALIASTAVKMVQAMGEAFGDSTFMIGPDQIMQAWNAKDSVQGMQNFAGQQAVSQMPFSGFLRAWAQSADPLVRSVKGFVAQIESALPGLSTNLPPIMDTYGQPVARQPQQQGVSGVLNPIRATTDASDPVDAEIGKHTLPPQQDPITGEFITQKRLFATLAAKEVASFSLTPEEGAMVQTLAGRATHQALAELFATAAYKKLDNAAQTKAITKAISDARHAARAAVADAILQKATTPAQIVRAADMRISLLSARWERAQFLAGLAKQGTLTAAVKTGIDRMLATKYKGQPTVAEYLKAAPLVAQYLAAPPFDRGNAAEWAALAAAKTKESALASRDKLDGTKTAQAFLATPEGRIITQYQGVPKGRDRAAIEARNAWVVPYLGGTTYVQVK